MSTIRARVPAGVSSGGEFARVSTPRAAVALSPPRLADANDHLRAALTDMPASAGALVADSIQMVTALAHELIRSMPPEWLPEVISNEDGDYIESLSECARPEVAAGSCIMVSEAVTEYLDHGDSASVVGRPHRIEAVQGLDDPGPQLTCHYALLVQPAPAGAPVMLDFTFSQIDPSAPFPLVTDPDDWLARIGHLGPSDDHCPD